MTTVQSHHKNSEHDNSTCTIPPTFPIHETSDENQNISSDASQALLHELIRTLATPFPQRFLPMLELVTPTAALTLRASGICILARLKFYSV